MRSRSRLRRLFKWAGTVGCVLILLAAVACLIWRSLAFRNDYIWAVGLHGGALSVGWFDSAIFIQLPGAGLKFEIGDRYNPWASKAWRYALVPRFERIPRFSLTMTIPLWIPFVLIGVPTALLWRLDRRRPLPGHCRRCNYDLTGNTSGKCPECGVPL